MKRELERKEEQKNELFCIYVREKEKELKMERSNKGWIHKEKTRGMQKREKKKIIIIIYLKKNTGNLNFFALFDTAMGCSTLGRCRYSRGLL